MAVGTRCSENVKNETVERLDRDGRILDAIVAALELSIPDDAGFTGFMAVRSVRDGGPP